MQTADETILERGTAYLTDAGMCGPAVGVLGREREPILQRFRTSMPAKFPVANWPVRLCGAVVQIDEATGRALSIARISKIVENRPPDMHASAAFLFPYPVAALCGCSGHGGSPVKRGQNADYKKTCFNGRPPSHSRKEKAAGVPPPLPGITGSWLWYPESKDFPRFHIFRMKQRTETRAPLFSLISHTPEQTRDHEL